MGNTQDVALRAWLKAHGMKSADKGGDVMVMPWRIRISLRCSRKGVGRSLGS